MQANREDRQASREAPARRHRPTLIAAIAVLILAGVAYLSMRGGREEPAADRAETAAPAPAIPPATPPAPAPEAAAIREAPDIPEPPEAERPAPAPAPPTPEALDRRLRDALAEAGLDIPRVLENAVSAPYLLDRGISSMDQVARGLAPRRTLNIARPAGAFASRREGRRYFLDPAGYRRYDALTEAIGSLPAGTLAGLFQTFRPQLRDTYASLGYPIEAMDNTLIAALDAIIAAPTREQPPELVSKGALWAYRDADLESRSDLQKQLLRFGPDNTRRLQQWAKALRAALLDRPQGG